MTPRRSSMSAVRKKSEAPSPRRGERAPTRRQRFAAHAPNGPGPELPGDRPVETPQETPDESPFDSPEEHPDSVPPQSPPNPPPEMPELPRSAAGVAPRGAPGTTRFAAQQELHEDRVPARQKCFQRAGMLLPFKHPPSTNAPIPVYPGSASSTMGWHGNAGSMRPVIRGCAWHTSARRAA